MAITHKSLPRATAADLLAIPEEERFHEVIDGKLVRKASATERHGIAQLHIVSQIGGAYNRRPSARGPGGWWILTQVEIGIEPHEIYRPDVVGWVRAEPFGEVELDVGALFGDEER
jgi:hypothetical protein